MKRFIILERYDKHVISETGAMAGATEKALPKTTSLYSCTAEQGFVPG